MSDCTTPRDPFVGSGRIKEGGYLAVHKQDFMAHIKGTEWNHYADQVLMCPPLETFPGDDVQTVLEQIEILINTLGGMFVTIGLTESLNVDYVVGSVETPTLASALTAAFADPHIATAGGIVVILSGTYSLDATITIPHGVMVWGENGGVIISGDVSSAPMFIIEAADETKRLSIGYDSVSEVLAQTSVQSSKLVGMTLVDNLNKTGGGLPNMGTVPMVSCQKGCNVIFDSVTFIGCIAPSGSATTLRAIGFNTTIPLSTNTRVDVLNCVIDGVSSGIQLLGNNGAADFLNIDGCRIRYFGTGSSTGDKAAIYTTLCNANIQNNKIIGYYLSGVFEPAEGILINSTMVSSPSDVRFNVINNSGGNGQDTGSEQLSFINASSYIAGLSAGQAFKGLTSRGNNWGTAYGSQDFEIVVGNSNFVGDINGTYALELALSRARIADVFSHSQITIYVLPGEYVVRDGGNLTQSARLIGLPSANKQVTVTLALATAESDGIRNTLYLGNEIKNINFTGSTDLAFRSITVTSNYLYSTNTVVENCGFYDCGLTINKNGSYDSRYSRNVTVSGCSFYQISVSFPNNLSLWIPTSSFDVINVNDSQFFGSGFQLFIGKDYRNYVSREGVKVNVKNCEFDCSVSTNPTVITATLPAPWSTYQNRYLTIEDTNADIDISGCVFKCTQTDTLINQTILDAGATQSSAGIASWSRVVGKRVKIDKMDAFGLWQGQSGIYLIPFLDGYGVSRFTMTDSTIVAGLPVHIYDNSAIGARGTYSGSKEVLFDNCVFSQPATSKSFDSITCLYVYLPTFESEYDPYGGTILDIPRTIPKISINNCSIQQTIKPSGASFSSFRNVKSEGLAGNLASATCTVHAENWSININNNTILSKHPSYQPGFAALAIQNQHPLHTTQTDWIGHVTISNNKIITQSQAIIASDVANYGSICLYLAWSYATITGNIMSYLVQDSSSGYLRGFIKLKKVFYNTITSASIAEGGCNIQNNVFYKFGNFGSYSAFWLVEENALTDYVYADCIFDNNVISSDAPDSSSMRNWFNVIPGHWRVRILQTQNANIVPGLYDPPNNVAYQSAEITYYCWNDEPYQPN